MFCIGLWEACHVPHLKFSSCFILLTTILFHGAHIIGQGEYADITIMPFDFLAITMGALFIVLESTDKTMVLIHLALTLVLWLVSFHEVFLKMPLNITQSIIHMLGVLINIRVFKDVCGTPN